MGVWAFVYAFSQHLGLAPVSPQELAAALERGGDSPLLAEMHVHLLREVLQSAPALRPRQAMPPHGCGLTLQQLPLPVVVSATNWPEVLRSVSYLLPSGCGDEPEPEVAEALRALRLSEYPALSSAHKLTLLTELVETLTTCPAFDALLKENERKQGEARIKFAQEMNALVERSRQAAMREAQQRPPLAVRRIHDPHHAHPLQRCARSRSRTTA